MACVDRSPRPAPLPAFLLLPLLLLAPRPASGAAPARYRVDASAEGCTGVFWRVWSPAEGRFVVRPDQQHPPWPRNGAVVEGRPSEEHPGFLLLDHDLFLPFGDDEKRYTYLHPVATVAAGAGAPGANTSFLPAEPVELSAAYDVVIVGSGPAGLTAAIYAGRSARSVLVLGGPIPGGPMMLSRAVENFPAVGAKTGAELMADLVSQAKSFGAKFKHGSAVKLYPTVQGQSGPVSGITHFGTEMGDGTLVRSRSVIVATGAKERWLGLLGEEPLRGKSLHTCAYCDGAFYSNRAVCVIGGGDGALEAAEYLARIAKSVTLVHRRSSWRGSAAVAGNVEGNPSVKILRPFDAEAWVVHSGRLVGAKLRHAEDRSVSDILCDGVFVAIGRDPQSGIVPKSVPRDARSFILPDRHSMTGIPGLFVAGQVADGRYQQAVTAAAAGAQAAMDAARWLDGEFDAGVADLAAGGVPGKPGLRGLRMETDAAALEGSGRGCFGYLALVALVAVSSAAGAAGARRLWDSWAGCGKTS